MDSKILEQNLKCPICYELAIDPFESSCCGHLFCKSCTKGLKYKTCPICREEHVEFHENFFAKKLLEEVKVKCHWGCEEHIEFCKMRQHRLICKCVIFKCNFKDCKWDGIKKDLLTHMIVNHPDYLVAMAENFSKFDSKMNKIINEGSSSVKALALTRQFKKKEVPIENKEVLPRRLVENNILSYDSPLRSSRPKRRSSSKNSIGNTPMRIYSPGLRYKLLHKDENPSPKHLYSIDNHPRFSVDNMNLSHNISKPASIGSPPDSPKSPSSEIKRFENKYKYPFKYSFSSPLHSKFPSEGAINERWVKEIMELTKCSREKALLTLVDTEGDLVNAILKITAEGD